MYHILFALNGEHLVKSPVLYSFCNYTKLAVWPLAVGTLSSVWLWIKVGLPF